MISAMITSRLISMFKLRYIILTVLILTGLSFGNVEKDPLRIVMLSGRLELHWRLIMSGVNEVDGPFDIYPQIAVDTFANEFKIRIKSKRPLQFIGDRTRFEGGEDSLRIEITNVNEETILVAGSLTRISMIISHRLSNKNMFIFDIYNDELPLGRIAGTEGLLFNHGIPTEKDSIYSANLSQIIDDFKNEEIAVSISKTVQKAMLMKSLYYTSIIFAILLLLSISLAILRFFKKKRMNKKAKKKTGQTDPEKEQKIRAIMAAENISYDEAELKLDVG